MSVTIRTQKKQLHALKQQKAELKAAMEGTTAALEQKVRDANGKIKEGAAYQAETAWKKFSEFGEPKEKFAKYEADRRAKLGLASDPFAEVDAYLGNFHKEHKEDPVAAYYAEKKRRFGADAGATAPVTKVAEKKEKAAAEYTEEEWAAWRAERKAQKLAAAEKKAGNRSLKKQKTVVTKEAEEKEVSKPEENKSLKAKSAKKGSDAGREYTAEEWAAWERKQKQQALGGKYTAEEWAAWEQERAERKRRLAKQASKQMAPWQNELASLKEEKKTKTAVEYTEEEWAAWRAERKAKKAAKKAAKEAAAVDDVEGWAGGMLDAMWGNANDAAAAASMQQSIAAYNSMVMASMQQQALYQQSLLQHSMHDQSMNQYPCYTQYGASYPATPSTMSPRSVVSSPPPGLDESEDSVTATLAPCQQEQGWFW